MKGVTTNIRNQVLKISFQGTLEAKNLAAIHAGIIRALKKSFSKVVVEIGSCEKYDFSFIQLLLILKTHLDQKGLDAEFNPGFSAEDTDLLTRLNIMNLLQNKTENK